MRRDLQELATSWLRGDRGSARGAQHPLRDTPHHFRPPVFASNPKAVPRSLDYRLSQDGLSEIEPDKRQQLCCEQGHDPLQTLELRLGDLGLKGSEVSLEGSSESLKVSP